MNSGLRRISWLWLAWVLGGFPTATWALDSYRYLRVTIDTPWMIFLGLAVVVLLPFFILMVLYWYYAVKKPSPSDDAGSNSE